MPTIIRHDGFTVRLHGPPREHPPPHVHVYKGKDGLVIIRLRMSDRPQKVWRVYDMNESDVVVAFRLVEANHGVLTRHWEGLHGKAAKR